MRDDADLPSHCRPARHLVPANAGASPGRPDEAAQQAEQCGLSRTVGPEECESLAGVHLQTYSVYSTPGSKGSGNGIRLHRRDRFDVHVTGKVLLWRVVCKID